MTLPTERGRAALLRDWRAERSSAAIYRALAARERSPRARRVYRTLAEGEERHAARLAAELREGGAAPPPYRPGRRTRLLLWLARRVDPALVLPHLARLEQLEADGYLRDLERGALLADERRNAELLRRLGHHEFSEFVKKILLRARRPVILGVGAALFLVSLLLLRNAQIEGLVFGLLTGVLVGPVTHYLIGKLAAPLLAGRVWCGWACWTAALLDQLPWKRSDGWRAPRWRRLRSVHLLASALLVAVLVLGFGYTAGAVGRHAALWFLVGNLVYWTVGVLLAWRLRDNRAFCKYVCPVAAVLRRTGRPALVKIAGDADACRSCVSHACETVCPMDIRISEYVLDGTRVLSSECIFCQQCVAVCPPNTLEPRFGLDLGGVERLQERPRP